MILVTGSILAREDTFDDVLRSCIEHVERSRKEPGCISHDVHVDCQNPMRLFFFEQWADEAALRTHFAVEGSKAFVRSLKGRIVERRARRSIAPSRSRDREAARLTLEARRLAWRA
jgi:quinol monooxygenase YgiN